MIFLNKIKNELKDCLLMSNEQQIVEYLNTLREPEFNPILIFENTY